MDLILKEVGELSFSSDGFNLEHFIISDNLSYLFTLLTDLCIYDINKEIKVFEVKDVYFIQYFKNYKNKLVFCIGIYSEQAKVILLDLETKEEKIFLNENNYAFWSIEYNKNKNELYLPISIYQPKYSGLLVLNENLELIKNIETPILISIMSSNGRFGCSYNEYENYYISLYDFKTKETIIIEKDQIGLNFCFLGEKYFIYSEYYEKSTIGESKIYLLDLETKEEKIIIDYIFICTPNSYSIYHSNFSLILDEKFLVIEGKENFSDKEFKSLIYDTKTFKKIKYSMDLSRTKIINNNFIKHNENSITVGKVYYE